MEERDTDVLIVGGGIVGAFCAWRLAEAGARVLLVDPGDAGARVSDGSLAWLNVSSTEDPAYARLRLAAMRGWQAVAAAHPDAPVALTGALMLGRGDAEAQAARLTALGWAADCLDGAALAAKVPGAKGAAVFTPGEGYAHPRRITDWVLARARKAGAVMLRDRVRRLERGAVRTTGGRIAAREVLVTVGNETPALLAPLGIDVPLEASPGIVMRTGPAPRVVPHVVVTPRLDLWQGADGMLRMSAALHETPRRSDAEMARAGLSELARLVPVLAGARVVETMRRDRPIPADGRPILGRAGQGLWLAVSHSGMTLAPVIAEALTDAILGRPARHDVARYGLGRFAAAAEAPS